jgi:integrase
VPDRCASGELRRRHAEQRARLPRIWPHLLRHCFSRRVAEKAVKRGLDTWRRLMNHTDLS